MKATKIAPSVGWEAAKYLVSTEEDRSRTSCNPIHPRRDPKNPEAQWFSEHIRIVPDISDHTRIAA